MIRSERVGAGQGCEPATDQKRVPLAPVLSQQQKCFTVWADACARARRLELHESEQRMGFGLVWHEFCQDATRPNRSASPYNESRIQAPPEVARYPSLKRIQRHALGRPEKYGGGRLAAGGGSGRIIAE